MAGISRSLLASMGLTEEQQKTIVDANAETLKEIRTERDALQSKVAELQGVQKELDDLKADLKTKYVAKEDHDKTVTEYQQYRDGVAAKEIKAAKEKAVRAYYEGKNIKGDNLKIAMMGSAKLIDAVEMDGDKIKNTEELDKLTGDGGAFASLVTKDTGARIDTGASLSGGNNPPQQSRAAQLYQQHYTALYGAQKGNESK